MTIRLLLCCAEDSEVDLVSVVDALHRDGMTPEVLPGVDADPELLARAVDEAVGPALFVLCQSPELDRSRIRRLTGLFSARAGTDQQIVSVLVTPRRPQAMLPPIRAAMDELVASLQERDEPPGEHVRMREVIQTRRPRQPTPSPDHLAHELMAELSKAEAVLERADSRDPANSGARRRVPSDSSAQQRHAARSGAGWSGSGSSWASASASGSTGRARHSIIERRRSSRPSSAIDERCEPEPHRGTDADLQTDSALPAATLRDLADTATLTETSRPGTPHRLLFVLGLCGMLGLALLGVLHQVSGLAERSTTARGQIPAAVAPSRPSQPRAVQPDPDRETLPVPATRDEAPALAPAVAPGGPAVPPSPPPDVDVDLSDGKRSIDAAISAGAVRSLDALLVIPPSRETMTWDGARAHCEDRPMHGLSGWRLPARAEIRRLRRARILRLTGTYWSAEKTDVADEAYAVDGYTGRSHVFLTVEPVGLPTCVRRR